MKVESMYKDYDKIQHMTTRDNATWRKLAVMNAILHLGGRTQNSDDYIAVMPLGGEFKDNVLECRQVFDDCIPLNTAFITHKDSCVQAGGEIGASMILLEEGKAIRITTTDQYDPW